MRFLQRVLRRVPLKFGIRALLVLVTIAAVLAATIGASYERVLKQRRVLARLSELGVSVTYEADSRGRYEPSMAGEMPAITWSDRLDEWLSRKIFDDAAYRVRRVYLTGPKSEEALLLVPELQSLEQLAFSVPQTATDIREDAWAALLRCGSLQSLTLRRPSHDPYRLTGLSKLSGLKRLSIELGNLTIDDVREIAELSQLTALEFQLTRTSDAALQPLSKLTGLEEFHLKHAGKSTTVTTKGVGFVASMPKLRRLTLARMPLIDDQILQRIAGLKQLTHLNLDQAGIRGTQLARLKNLDSLTTLNLIGTPTDDQAVEHLVQLPKLSDLNLAFTHVTDAGTPQLANLTQLVALQLSGTEISDETIPHLQDLALQELFIANTQVSDAGIDPLLKIGTLRVLGFAKTRITPKGTMRIKTALPNCQIW